MKVFIKLRCAEQMLQLFQSRERTEPKCLACHLDLFKHTAEFLRARARVALTAETGKL